MPHIHIFDAPTEILAKLRTSEHSAEGGSSERSCSGEALEASLISPYWRLSGMPTAPQPDPSSKMLLPFRTWSSMVER